MNIGYLYFLLPVVFFSIAGVVSVSIGRRIGSQKLSLYRQITLMLIGIPLLIPIASKGYLIEKHSFVLIISGILGTAYLMSSFYAMNQTSIGISRSFVAVSRSLSAFVIGSLIFHEIVTIWDFGGVFLIFLGFYTLSKANHEKIEPNDILGIIFSLIAGILYTLNIYVFTIYSSDFSAMESAYLLEFMNGIFLLILTFIIGKKPLREKFHIKQKDFFILSILAPLVLISSYGVAKSIHLIPFYVFHSLFVLTLIVSIALSWFFLKETFSLGRAISLCIMIAGCSIIVFT